MRAAAEAGADHVFANALFLKPCSAAVFLPFHKENFPQLVPDYENRFKDRAFLPTAYRKRISELFAQFRAKYRIQRDSGWHHETSQQGGGEQLALFA